ncbi:hypothetical protein AYO21_10704 [Fonsecaea monophora]|uniref:Uncharacterized protein n=1 Tax=Fonsecaea monophora TaxID=254056 RepID=A0A177ET25_9EURO|nr:hypothetical protein AYO21_10704 [Fonsecaea monophora]OAG35137.1 hypothetical protein AYO21_10704 [Fonsecaea monophora]
MEARRSLAELEADLAILAGKSMPEAYNTVLCLSQSVVIDDPDVRGCVVDVAGMALLDSGDWEIHVLPSNISARAGYLLKRYPGSTLNTHHDPQVPLPEVMAYFGPRRASELHTI